MARVTVEDCLKRISNRFILVLMAAKRSRQLLKGSKPLIEVDNKPVVTALREIAAGKVVLETEKEVEGPTSYPAPPQGDTSDVEQLSH